MPTVLRFRAMRFIIYLNDHEPPHVHVELPDGEVVVILDETTRAVQIRDVFGVVRPQDVVRIDALVGEYFETFIATWERYHR